MPHARTTPRPLAPDDPAAPARYLLLERGRPSTWYPTLADALGVASAGRSEAAVAQVVLDTATGEIWSRTPGAEHWWHQPPSETPLDGRR